MGELIKQPSFIFTEGKESAIQVIYWSGELIELKQDNNELIIQLEDLIKLVREIKKNKENAYSK